MTERPYETSVPDEVVIPAAPAYPVQGSSNGEGTSVGNEAKSVASDAADGGRQVAETAASGVKDVASEATTQLRQLLDQVRSELDDQASSQGQRAADGLRSLAGELRQMASSSQEQGIAGEVAGQAADRAASFADWLEHRQPGDMLDELRSLARRRPGAFLLGAAAVGLIGGRMTRSLAADDGSSSAKRPEGSRTAADRTTVTGVQPAAVAPSVSPVRGDSYTVGVRDTDTHAVTSTTSGVTSDPRDGTFSEGRSGVR